MPKDNSKNKSWDDLIEKGILGYRRWLPTEQKEKMLKFLYWSLRRKYKEPLSKEEFEFCKSKGVFKKQRN